ncbi:MAG TPA: DEAD/DEAH box helicase [Oscillospiraceae bacterium]|nr:DEAD/DEAH box helicase [Oscillospiraceae bacterium]
MEINGIPHDEEIRYDSLGLSEPIMKALAKKGYEIATPVQGGAIPFLMDRKDVIAKAPTGTGKTYAFGIPIIEHLRLEDEYVQALILAPTRELAIQIGEELRDLSLFMEGVRIVVAYGGQPIEKQISLLKKKPQIIVATPGRLMDHVKRRTLKLDKVETVVLDEADRMLDMGFIHDVTRILNMIGFSDDLRAKALPYRRNLAMLSATISREVMDIAWMYQRDAAEIIVPADVQNKPDIRQFRLDVDRNRKVSTLIGLMASDGGYDRVMVFCNTKTMTERLAHLLEMNGCPAERIHGDMSQVLREKVMDKFKKGLTRVLIATDVASRGIDVDDIDLVVNYDVPDENEYYVHRIGRTGRAKKHGVAYTLVSDFASGVRLDGIAKNTRNVITPMRIDENGEFVEKH